MTTNKEMRDLITEKLDEAYHAGYDHCLFDNQKVIGEIIAAMGGHSDDGRVDAGASPAPSPNTTSDIAVVNVKDVRRRVMVAIRSYGISHQDKADIESRADGVMIVLAEYVLPFVNRPEPVSIELAAEAAHNSYWAHEYDTAFDIEKAAARQQAVAIAKVWGLNYVD